MKPTLWLFSLAFAASALAQQPATPPQSPAMIKPGGEATSVVIGNGETVLVGQPEFDFSHLPPKLIFLLRNPTSFSHRLIIDVKVSWADDHCPINHAESWTGKVAPGENSIVIYDADLDGYADRCAASGFTFTASHLEPAWLDGCENTKVITALPKVHAGDTVLGLRNLFGDPTSAKTVSDTMSLFYIWRQRYGVWLYDRCSFRVDTRAGLITSVKPLSEAEAKEVETELEAAEAAVEEAHSASDSAQAKVEAARQQRLGAERKRKQAEEAARSANIRAEQDAKAAEQRAKIRVACSKIYQDTIDKKIRDLTVREEQQVRACQAFGMYPPQ